MKKIFLSSFFLIGLIILISLKIVEAQSTVCPPKTTPGYRFITFVGKAGLGGDQEVKVWFEYGNSPDNLDKKTKTLILKQDGIYCLREIKKINPCTTYYYRAAAQNSAGINYGEIKSIKTLCTNNSRSQQNQLKIFNWVIF